MDYDYVDPIFLHHVPFSLPGYHHHNHQDFQYNNYDVEGICTAAVVGADLSSWGNDDEKDVGMLESLLDQATRLVSTCPVSTITYYGGNIKMVNDDMRSMWFGYNPRQTITTRNSVDDITTSTTTMAVNNVFVPPSKNQHHHQFVQVPDNSTGVVLITNNTHGSAEIQHRTGKEKELEEIYAVNNEAFEMDNYAVNNEAIEIEHHRAGLFTYATTRTQKSEGSTKRKKCSTTSSTNQRRSQATILRNKAERKKRDKINQKMEALKRLVPNICHKTDKATILDQVIEYIKKLQNQRDQLMMMSSYEMNNNMTYPLIPMPMQQHQLQMSMMAPDAQMGMGVDLIGSMHTNLIMHPNMSTTGTSRTPAIVHPIVITRTFFS